MSSHYKKYSLSGIILLLMAALIFAFSYICAWTWDDVYYQFNLLTGARIHSIGDIIESQVHHYVINNGRFVAHTLVQLMLWGGHGLFAIANACAYILLVVLIMRISGAQVRQYGATLTATLLVLLMCDTFYTPSNQIGYVWMADTALMFVLLFEHAGRVRLTWVQMVFAAVFCLIAGDGNEAINVGLAASVGIYTLVNIRRLSVAQWVCVVSFSIGVLFLCLSPGIIARAQDEASTNVLRYLLHIAMETRVFLLFIAVLIYYLIRGNVNLKKFYLENIIISNALLVLLVFNLITGVTTWRQLFGVELFSCVLLVKLLKGHRFNFAGMMVLLIAVLVIYKVKYGEIKRFNTTFQTLYTEIERQQSGRVYVDFPNFNRAVNPVPSYDYDQMGSHIKTIQALIYDELRIPYPSAVTRPLETGDEYPKIEVLPKAFLEIDTITGNKAYNIDWGNYVLCQDREHPARFSIERYIEIFGLKIPYKPFEVTFDDDGEYNTENHKVVFGTFYSPLISNGEVIITEE